MAEMVEQSFICKVLDAPDLEIIFSHGLREDMFLTCGSEIRFIINHYNEYKQMPDKITFLGQFKDFQMLDVTESVEYLVYKLKEAYVYTKMAPILQDTADKVREDSIKALDFLKDQLRELEASTPTTKNKDGYDIVANAKDRLSAYK